MEEGPSPESPNDEKLSGLGKLQLQRLYESKYENVEGHSPETFGWTIRDDEQLQAYKDGVITDFINDTGLVRAFAAHNEYLAIQLQNVDMARKKVILGDVWKKLSSVKRDALIDYLNSVALASDMDCTVVIDSHDGNNGSLLLSDSNADSDVSGMSVG